MPFRDVLFASRNAYKLAEVRGLLEDLPVHVVSPDDLGLHWTPAEDGIERWASFEANALAKAAWFRGRTGMPTMSDDSGLCVDALAGGPGVWSRRFAPEAEVGDEGRDSANNRHLLARLEGRTAGDRGAHYRCALAYVEPRYQVVIFGRCDGRIADEPRGSGGFGYDPLFLVPDTGRTFGELSPEIKAARSHRAAAVRALRPWLE